MQMEATYHVLSSLVPPAVFAVDVIHLPLLRRGKQASKQKKKKGIVERRFRCVPNPYSIL